MGKRIAEGLAEDRLEIDIWTAPADFSAAGDDSERVVTIRAVGPGGTMSISACCAVLIMVLTWRCWSPWG